MKDRGCFPRKCVAIFALLVSSVCMTPASHAIEPIADSFRFPLEGEWNPSRGFAEAFIPRWCGFHLADDVPTNPGTPVFPFAKGTVKFAEVVSGIGYAVVVQHRPPPSFLLDPDDFIRESRVTTKYYHLRRPEDGGITLVLGQGVDPRAALGYVSGRPEDYGTDPHLHFGIRRGPFNSGIDPRTEKWFYPGYTAIYRDGVRQCDEMDPVHMDIISGWMDPTPAVQYLSFVQGNPGIPGDGIVIGLSGGVNSIFLDKDFELEPPFPLAGITDGITVSAFPPSTTPATRSMSLQVQFSPIGPWAACTIGVQGTEVLTPIVNGIQGIAISFSRERLNSFVNFLRETDESCGDFSLDQFAIRSVILLDLGPVIVEELDALAVSNGEFAFAAPN